MTRDEIIRMAREAGMEQDLDMWFSPSYEQCDVHIVELERFAQLVAAAEREACAKLCDKEIEEWGWDADVVDVGAAIRARGQQ